MRPRAARKLLLAEMRVRQCREGCVWHLLFSTLLRRVVVLKHVIPPLAVVLPRLVERQRHCAPVLCPWLTSRLLTLRVRLAIAHQLSAVALQSIVGKHISWIRLCVLSKDEISTGWQVRRGVLRALRSAVSRRQPLHLPLRHQLLQPLRNPLLVPQTIVLPMRFERFLVRAERVISELLTPAALRTARLLG